MLQWKVLGYIGRLYLTYYKGNFEISLASVSHLNNIPGDKTDKKDSKRIAKLLLAGLLRGSFIPCKPKRDLRDLTRYKRKIVGI